MIDFKNNKIILHSFYETYGISNAFEKDCFYLEDAFNEILQLWLDNYKQVEQVKYLMIAEAPLWGIKKKYIYNPEVNNSQFFHRNDLGAILNTYIPDKKTFINSCNEIGLIVIDISPFPLNADDTSINYRSLSKSQYKQLVQLTIPHFFAQKIKYIKAKQFDNIKTFFRYARVKENFQEIIGKVLIEQDIIKDFKDIGEISQQGGGIDKAKLKQIILS
jgi:hypothetical protein